MQTRLLDIDDLSDYHDYISSSAFGDVLQTAAWARLKAQSGWKPHFLTVEDEGRIAAACLALERKLPRMPLRLLYCPRGPVTDWQIPDALPAMTSALRSLGHSRNAILVKVDPPAALTLAMASRSLEDSGFQPVRSEGFGGTQPKCVMKLDLSNGADAAFETFKPKWRYNIRLAERKGVTVREGTEADMDGFYNLLLETARRDGFLVRGREYFHTMWRELAKDGLIRLFLAEFEGRCVAGALMYILGAQAWYTYGASSNEHRNVMPNHLMQWRMIQAAALAGCTVYDFRGVSCNRDETQDDHLQGLNRFKAGFNADFVEYVGEDDLPISRPLHFAWTHLAPKALRLLKRRVQTEAAD